MSGHTAAQKKIKATQEAKEIELKDAANNIAEAAAAVAKTQADIAEKGAVLEAKMAEFEIRLSKASAHSTDANEVHSEKLPSESPISMGEIGVGSPIERASETNFVEEVELEAFMAEMVQIRVAEDGTENATAMAIPMVNGKNLPIIRGVPTWIPRRFVEALARARVTRFDQKLANPNERDSLEMVPMAATTYPFSVIEDKNPKGAAWLQAILEQP